MVALYVLSGMVWERGRFEESHVKVVSHFITVICSSDRPIPKLFRAAFQGKLKN